MGLRFRYRHVHATLFNYVRSNLVELGWGNAGLAEGDPANATVNFGVDPMTFIDFQPDESGTQVAAQTLAVTLGEEPPSEDQELGAGLTQVRYPVYVDIFAANQAVAIAVTSDLKDLLEDIYLSVVDQTTGDVTDDLIEIWHEDISSARPQASLGAQDFKRYWRTLRFVARVDYLV